MKTVLMFPYAHHLGATHPLLAIGEVLRKQKHRVIFAAQGKCCDYVRAAGFELEDIIDLAPSICVDKINKSRLDYHTVASITEFVEQETRMIRKYSPDVIVDVHRPTLRISALLSSTPRAVVCNTVLTKYYALEKVVPESLPIHSTLKALLRNRTIGKAMPLIERQLLKKWAQPYNIYLKGRGVVRFKSIWELFEGDQMLLMDASEFAPTTPLPDSVKMVGPLLHDDNQESPPWLAKLDPAKKTIFVYVGSIEKLFPVVLDFLEKIYGGSSDHQIVAATGGMFSSGSRKYPANMIIADYVPASRILENNCAVMVTHGGRGSIYSALLRGVPLIGIPNQAEQEWNLDRIEELGLGKKILVRKLNLNSLKDALDSVLQDRRYGERAQKFGEILANYQGATKAAEIIAAM